MAVGGGRGSSEGGLYNLSRSSFYAGSKNVFACQVTAFCLKSNKKMFFFCVRTSDPHRIFVVPYLVYIETILTLYGSVLFH